MERKQIEEYYDGHAADVQERTGLNQRHRSIFRKTQQSGLGPADHVLEIGCGIGLLSELFSSYLKQGGLLSVDISPKAVELARKRLSGRKNVSFMVSDMQSFAVDRKFDRILLPDVLEHIPEGQHPALFDVIARHLGPEGKVLIHIPDPNALDRLRIENPGLLQIVDQSLAILPMMERFNAVGLALERYEPYGLWTKDPDYDWIVFSWPRSGIPLAKRGWADRIFRELIARFK